MFIPIYKTMKVHKRYFITIYTSCKNKWCSIWTFFKIWIIFLPFFRVIKHWEYIKIFYYNFTNNLLFQTPSYYFYLNCKISFFDSFKKRENLKKYMFLIKKKAFLKNVTLFKRTEKWEKKDYHLVSLGWLKTNNYKCIKALS